MLTADHAKLFRKLMRYPDYQPQGAEWLQIITMRNAGWIDYSIVAKKYEITINGYIELEQVGELLPIHHFTTPTSNPDPKPRVLKQEVAIIPASKPIKVWTLAKLEAVENKAAQKRTEDFMEEMGWL